MQQRQYATPSLDGMGDQGHSPASVAPGKTTVLVVVEGNWVQVPIGRSV